MAASDALFPHPHGEQGTLDEVAINPLDQPQDFEPATSYRVRDELQDYVARDLLGPYDGETEEFRPGMMGPRERYLVGMLGPKRRLDPDAPRSEPVQDTDPDAQGDAGGEHAGELPEIIPTQNLGRMWASSMGLSCRVDATERTGTDVLAVTVTWGQYTRRRSTDEDGKARTVWAREPAEAHHEVRLDGPADQRIPLLGGDPAQPGVHLAVAVRQHGAARTVRLTLINDQLLPDSNADTGWLFQTRITVTALDGHAPVFQPIDDPLVDPAPDTDDPEDLHLRLLYRHELQYANGHNVAVHATSAPATSEPATSEPGTRRANRLETTWVPSYDVPPTIAPTGAGSPLAGAMLAMDALATAEPAALRSGLAPLADGYTEWLDEQETAIGDLPERLWDTAYEALRAAREAEERIQTGIELLADPAVPGHADALRAFRFANRAMAEQRRRTELARRREDQGLSYAEAKAAVDAEGDRNASWRPFQLAFVLLNLPSLTNPAHRERTGRHHAVVDLLFFPTGGGKTEAYLGLTAFTFAIRRLQGVVGTGGDPADARDGMAGVAVLMRYTLRLLTAQQFQRAAALVCAAEVQRAEDEATWGSEPFRIGLWVGGAVSPNWYDDAAREIGEARDAGAGAGAGSRTKVLQTLTCPWCGTALHAQQDLEPDEPSRRIRLFCGNGEGALACPFSRTRSTDGLPILTVDEEIYRYAPSLVIATVDKLAQLPWRGYAGILFGRVARRCPRHGYRHADLDKRTGCADRHNATRGLPAVRSEPAGRLRPPDLIIQDELHLISGALGTTVGLFEAAVDQLCSWTVPSHTGGTGTEGTIETGPKIVASTATTKRAADQVRGVFGRELRIFPPQVLDIGDTFFSRQVPVTEATPGRRYLGLCAHGIRLKAAEIRLAEILLLAGQTLLNRYGARADPYLTVVGYFNATRELAGMRRSLDDQVTVRVRKHGRAKGLADRIASLSGMLNIQELTSRISSGDISDVLKRLEIGFDPELDSTVRRRAINQQLKDTLSAKGGGAAQPGHPLVERFFDRSRGGATPVDYVLATSMLQVGVDVARFGLMVVTGQPKNTAEYIQASSRVGRDLARPGLVVTLYNWTRPRDLAHYEDFEHYHATFYRQVEALSVTPYTSRSVDRGAAATLIAAVRNLTEANSRNTDAQDVDVDSPAVAGIVAKMLDRAEAVAGPKGRDHLRERLDKILARWRQAQHGAARLGYEKGGDRNRQHLVGLLQKTGDGRWSETTVGLSMRETENEINLLVPGVGLTQAVYDAPPWRFGPPPKDAAVPAASGGAADGIDGGDEMGESALAGKKGASAR